MSTPERLSARGREAGDPRLAARGPEAGDPRPGARGAGPGAMRLYPPAPGRRAATILADALIVALLALFAALALNAHDAVEGLAGIARGVESAGEGAEAALDSAADQVDGVPLVGGALASALREAGAGTGGDAAELGRSGQRDIAEAADVIGWSLFLIPTVLLLIGYLPNRWAQIQRINAAMRALGSGSAAAEHPHLVAMRAVFGLPYSTLLRYTDDPFGDLERGDYEALLRAAHDEAGVVPRRREPSSRRR